MNIYATIYDNRNGKLWNVSNAITDLKISSYMTETPGKCTFKLIKSDGIAFWEGATVSIQVDGVNMFKGYVFKKERTQEVNLIDCTCYDQLRYLKNKDFYKFEGLTSDGIFKQICNDFVLKYRVVDKSSHICTPKNNDGSTLYEMIQSALDDTLIHTREWYFIRDNFGVLEHLNVTSCVKGIILGDKSGITEFKYSTSIEDNTYNQIKLYRDNKDTKKRETFIVNDTINGGQNLREWGILQLYEKVDEKLNIAQIEEKARSMLKLYNNVKRSFTLTSLGVLDIFAGCLFKLQIADLGDISMNEYLMITECTHTFSNGVHKMELTTEVVRE